MRPSQTLYSFVSAAKSRALVVQVAAKSEEMAVDESQNERNVYIKEKELNSIQPARKAKHEIEDMVVKGMALITQEAKLVQDSVDVAGERENSDVEMSAMEVVDPDEDLWDLFGPISAEDLCVEGLL